MFLRKHRAGLVASLLVATAVVVVGVRPTPNRVEAAGQPGGEAKSAADGEIRKANADYATALTAGDVDAIMAFWAPDADYIDEAGQQTKGAGQDRRPVQEGRPRNQGVEGGRPGDVPQVLRPEICLEDGAVERPPRPGSRRSTGSPSCGPRRTASG